MTTEYRVMVKLWPNYSPHVEARFGDDPELAGLRLREVRKELPRWYQDGEAWLESRLVGEWERDEV